MRTRPTDTPDNHAGQRRTLPPSAEPDAGPRGLSGLRYESEAKAL